ncbi:class I SAM-dependent methyltransferase [Streptococcus dysgalactiae]|uniref:Class I SAM-dependent methyltransferase n=2 Tax=Streptococcus dysgalactiae TaxID=1334 RepID=A0AAE9UMC3_STRDY|nr:class I SAM-dependent methyltransferase [Streptococcus dysgalactiae]QGH04114.1 class I SAM-dependent methyltransferase [Streptococcus dysgalactiae subsp. dysgalactiae]WAI93257.1 class I SAM-dependent methyltransferase [Streptococcus dysgalactiae]WCE85471.1 methyltransferase domain-containing protein [Streptococcus dysgalactiae]WCN25471.1 methyltransferase domain-containing protein [Streptococcus dysgalactiae]BBE39422.1 putative S-adenosyl-L-methionine-dependent methyltransferase [Streptococ
MTANLETYKDMLQQPWGRLMYDIIFSQLGHHQNQHVLDFGAGFCLTAERLAANNQVIAIEPNPDLLFAHTQDTITKINGSLESLHHYADNTFDLIICHNVLEYISPQDHPVYLKEFERILKQGGTLSLVKHNHVGKVLHSVVFENDCQKALQLLKGDAFESLSFSAGQTFSIEDLLSKTQLLLQHYYGIRTVYGLQPNAFKTTEEWRENLLEMELAICDLKPYKDIAFLQHLILKKNKTSFN